MNTASFLKSLPIDLGQATMRGTTKGKQIALEMVPNGDGKKALDLGCREGLQSRWLENKGYVVTSADIEKVYEKAIEMNADEDWPFADHSFDLIWCSEVIEHLKSPAHFKAEAMRTLKPGGRLILTTPNSFFWLYWLAGLFGKGPAELQNPHHQQFFSIQDIRNLFPEADVFGFFPYSVLRFRIRKRIGALSPTFVVRDIKGAK